MNRIVKEHYPVEKLPADLREGLGDATHVRITVENKADDEAILVDLDAKLQKAMTDVASGRGLSADQVRASLADHAKNWAPRTK
jgi:bifunctional DNA-binding transcriptional regulator/antitoxin component of YhaV-PrlF toxin-antitoxin module